MFIVLLPNPTSQRQTNSSLLKISAAVTYEAWLNVGVFSKYATHADMLGRSGVLSQPTSFSTRFLIGRTMLASF
jgi:hypothetical protein